MFPHVCHPKVADKLLEVYSCPSCPHGSCPHLLPVPSEIFSVRFPLTLQANPAPPTPALSILFSCFGFPRGISYLLECDIFHSLIYFLPLSSTCAGLCVRFCSLLHPHHLHGAWNRGDVQSIFAEQINKRLWSSYKLAPLRNPAQGRRCSVCAIPVFPHVP